MTAAFAAGPAEYELQIERQSLSRALQEFAEQSGVQIIFFSEFTDGYEAPSLSGRFTAAAALSRLLIESGLTYRELNSRTIEVQPKAAVSPLVTTSSADGSMIVPQVAVGPESWRLAQASTTQTKLSAPSSDIEMAQVVVTGTRVRTSKSASPMIVLTQEELKKRGLSTVEDIIRSLPQGFSTVNAAATLDNSINVLDARGQSAADLRGLGPENTLVLVNGRRRASSSSFNSGLVNLNTIPVGAIERVEIVTDGASAVYGSDAVAGVINFILKKDYQGAETRVRQEIGANEGDSSSVDQLLGASWGSGSVTFNGHYSSSDSVDTRKAGLTTLDFRPWGGIDERGLTLGQPGVVLELGSLPATDDGTTGIAGRLAPENRVPYDPGALVLDGTAETRSLSFYVTAEQQLTERLRAYAEVTYANNDSESSAGVPTASYIPVPATNRFNDLGSTVLVSYAFVEEWRRGLIPSSTMVSDQEALAATLGFKFTLPGDWSIDMAATRSREEALFSATGLNFELLNQRAAGLDANGAPLPAEQHLNLFGNGTAQNPAALQGLLIEGGLIPASTSVSTEDAVQLTGEGPLLRLPAGEMRLAGGMELRRHELDDGSDARPFLVETPGGDTIAGFAEIAVPLIGEQQGVPGVDALDVFAAARREEYSIDGPFDGPTNPSSKRTFSRTSPKYGVSWKVTSGLQARATFSKSFRKPDISELFRSPSGPYNYLLLVDPQNPGDGLINPPAYFGGNPDLGPETSDNLSVGFDWTPAGLLKGFSVSVTYSEIDFTNRVGDTVELALREPSLIFELPGVVTRGPDNRITRIDLVPLNLASRKNEALDLTAAYTVELQRGALTFGFTGTRVSKLEDVLVPGGDPQQLVGTQSGPEQLKWRGSLSWAGTNYGLNLYAHHSSSYVNGTFSPSMPQPVDSYLTYDLTGYYRLKGGSWSFNAGVRNLLDEEFPFFNGFGRPWDPRRVDTRGRTLYLEISKEFELFR